ncbi:MAG: aminoglycoside phosphotransferase family protein, partial [Puniceicoccales bacterium]|nr:aminoglycoside phosphotransferase family protein [Puniceicoccales bacterium]
MRAALIAKQFNVQGRLVTVEQFGSGNVNDTYLAIFRTTFSETRFILQRIRKAVFPEPANIMHNMRIITDHCHAKLEAEADRSDRIWQLPKIIETKSGEDFAIDGDGELWRAITHIASASCYEKVQNPEHAYEAGYVLGHFQRLLSDIDTNQLVYTLPGFHVTPGYLKKLDDALDTAEGRERLESSSEARRCMKFVENRRERCYVLQQAIEKGILPLRPTHGDPKVGNIMIDEATGKGTCIVDLDTVQPGLIHYDIGDCMRSCCNPAGEDATDLGSVF